jgi:UPF0176 protein
MMLNVAFYQFVTLSDLTALREEFRALTEDLPLRGTILLSEEGINGMLSGEEKAVREIIAFIEARPPFRKLIIKESRSEKFAYYRMLVKIKKEIIPMGRPDIRPAEFTAERLEPKDLKKWLDEGKDVILLDTRNEYEIDYGTFKGARRMGLKFFRDFSKSLKGIESEIKDKPVVMFCTGGIRCEKAAALALKEEFKEVYQLEGGILRYFEDCGDAHYEGNCFVFDKRVALQPDLEPDPKAVRAPYPALDLVL